MQRNQKKKKHFWTLKVESRAYVMKVILEIKELNRSLMPTSCFWAEQPPVWFGDLVLVLNTWVGLKCCSIANWITVTLPNSGKGLRPFWLMLVTFDHKVGKKLVQVSRIDFISCIYTDSGSTPSSNALKQVHSCSKLTFTSVFHQGFYVTFVEFLKPLLYKV